MKAFEFSVTEMKDWDAVVDCIAGLPVSLILFSGNLGAGKTTLIQRLCRKWGVEEAVTSPTFSLVNAYKSGTELFYHFDLYRLKTPEELPDIGWYEYLDSGAKCLVEWPEMAAEILAGEPHAAVRIDLKDGVRRVAVTIHPEDAFIRF